MDLSIEVSRGTLFLNGTPVTALLDSRSCAWFKSNDIAAALGFSNASSSVTQRISPEERKSFKDLHLHEDSPSVDAHGRNIFINQRGLISFLSDRYPGASLAKLQNAGQLLRGRSVSETRGEGARAGRPPVRSEGPHASPVLDGSGVALMLNGDPLPFIVDDNKNPWFKANDVAMVLGLSKASSSITTHVSETDKIMFRKISLHKNSPLLDAHPCNIFINQNGMVSVLSAKRRTPLAVDVSVQVPSNSVTRGDKIQLTAIYSLFKMLNGLSLSQSSEKASPSKSTAILSDAQPQLQQRAVPRFVNGSIIIKDLLDPSDDVYKLFAVDTLSDDYLVRNDVVWVRKVHEAPKLLDLIQFFLSEWELRTATYRLALEPLTDMVAKICSNFEKTIDFICKYSPRNNVFPQRISDERIEKIIAEPNSSGRIEWIYVASCERYIKRNVFKVGHTTRLKKRIEGYRTGRLEEDFLYYVKVIRVHSACKIDSLISVFLDSWSQKIKTETRINKTEMYMLDFDSVCEFVNKIIDLFDDSHDYVQARSSAIFF